MRALATTTIMLTALILAGCSSHEGEFEDRVPPPPDRSGTAAELADAAAQIVLLYRDDIDVLAADALAPLTQASALTFRATGAPGMLITTRRYADVLLRARVPRARGQAFFGSERPNRADAAITARSVDALIDAFLATRDERYREAAISGATALASPSLGMIGAPGGLVLRDPWRRGRGRNVALTAEGARALRRAADPLMGAPTMQTSDALLAAVEDAQQGLGRWFAFLGKRVPMDMESWATTLFSIASLRGESPVQGIAGAGIPALFRTGFTTTGKPNLRALPDGRGRGVALAISAFDAFTANPTYARLVTARVLESRREDGTVLRVARDDAQGQALYAAALARRSLSLRRRPT